MIGCNTHVNILEWVSGDIEHEVQHMEPMVEQGHKADFCEEQSVFVKGKEFLKFFILFPRLMRE